MESQRKAWNKRHKELRSRLADPNAHSLAVRLFLQQHAEVHARALSTPETWSLEEELLADLTEAQIRAVPDRMEHSIAWVIWHISRIEDVTMSILVAGQEQLFTRDAWLRRAGLSVRHTGNAMSQGEVIALSQAVDLDTLRSYRLAVGHQTEAIVRALPPDEFRRKVPPARIEQLVQAEAIPQEARGLLDYWGRRTVAGLLLMPPTRHCFVHLNEGLRIKRKVL